MHWETISICDLTRKQQEEIDADENGDYEWFIDEQGNLQSIRYDLLDQASHDDGLDGWKRVVNIPSF
jgi:hypothetical protein